MADKPIAFSPAMVAAIIRGGKTETRRILGDTAALPYAPGDRLWVRETHYKYGAWFPNPQKSRKPDGTPNFRTSWQFIGTGETTFEPPRRVNGIKINPRMGPPKDDHGRPAFYRRPARFMFKSDARIFLRVESCIQQRLQDMIGLDAEAEGIAHTSKDGKLTKFGVADRDGLPGNDDCGWHWADWQPTPLAAFERLWDIIHGPGAWALNPFVSVTRFAEEN